MYVRNLVKKLSTSWEQWALFGQGSEDHGIMEWFGLEGALEIIQLPVQTPERSLMSIGTLSHGPSPAQDG